MPRFYGNTTLDDFLSSTRVTFNNAVQPDVLPALSIFGYDEARIQEGVALLETAVAREADQKRLYGKQYAATEALKQAWREADELYYSVHRRLARLALKNDRERRHALGLSERQKQTFLGRLQQATDFYARVLEDPVALEALAQFNVTRQHLEQGQAKVKEVETLKSIQEQVKSAAQAATQERDAVLDALSEWLSTFREVARMALASMPQHLESLQLGTIP
jgi:hypothetical protein